jgi:hypothetical protein
VAGNAIFAFGLIFQHFTTGLDLAHGGTL